MRDYLMELQSRLGLEPPRELTESQVSIRADELEVRHL